MWWHRLRSAAPTLLSVVILLGAALSVGATDPWDPLSGPLGTGVLAMATLAVGLTAGRYLAVSAALLLLVMVPITRAEEPTTAGGFIVVIVVPAAAGLIAVGVVARRAWQRRDERSGRPRPRRAAVGVAGFSMVLAITGTAVGVYLDHRVVDHVPQRPRVVDDQAATIDGIGYRSTLRDVRLRLGRPIVARLGDPSFGKPLDADDLVVALGTDGEATWRYPGVAVLVRDPPDRARHTTSRGRRFLRQWLPVDSIVVSDRDAQTRAGVGIGDSLELARRAYPGMVCDGILYGSDSTNPGDPRCGGGTPDGGAIWFAGDPIDTITLTGDAGAEPLNR